MGGKAMKLIGIETERKNTIEHLRIQSELTPIIGEMFNTPVKGIQFYREKETHGDLDLLIQNYGQLDKIHEKLSERFGKIFCNGAVYSFAYDNYQVDIIPQSPKFWDSCNSFWNWDPLGNLVGKVSHKLNLKFGFQGLEYPCRTFNGRYADDITISTDARKIYEFLGFDYDRYLLEFNTLQEIFDYVISSKYFDSDIFLMQNLNAIDRKRNAKRKTYQEFLKYINDNKIVKHYIFLPREEYLNIVNKHFPEADLLNKVNAFKERDAINRAVNIKFNGDLIMQWTDKKILGKELGEAIVNFQREITNVYGMPFKDWAINADEKNH